MTAATLTAAEHAAAKELGRRHRMRLWEPLPWLLALAGYFAFPNHLGFGTELLITILFALSLDLALGYAGIITLGHAAFFGAGAYTVGLAGLSRHLERADHQPAPRRRWWPPSSGLPRAWCCCARRGSRSSCSRLCTMALLEEAANLGHEYTGSFDGLPSLPIPPLFGVFEFNPLYPKTQYLYALLVLFLCFVFVRTLVYSPFGQSLTGIRENILRMHAVGSPVRRRLVLCYTISAAVAGIAGGLWAQTNAYVNLSDARPRPRRHRADHPHPRRLRPPLRRLRRRRRLHGAVAFSVEDTIRPPGSSASGCCWW